MIHWTHTAMDVRTLCSRPMDCFPVLARLSPPESEQTPSGDDEPDFQGPSSDPLVSYLLYSVRNCVKVSATSLRWDDADERLKSSGINYVIPLNYPGWFRILSDRGDRDSHIVPLTSIEQVVASKSTRFLVHSSMAGLWPSKSSSATTNTTCGRRDSFTEVRVPAGEVLSLGPVFVEPLEEKDDRNTQKPYCCLCPTSFFGRKTEADAQNEKMYVQCRGTTTGIDILLPLETYGQFSCIGTSCESDDIDDRSPATTPPVVYETKDLVNRKDFPQQVQLLYGTPPPLSPVPSEQSFTGLMALEETYSEQSILACRISGDDRLVFVEFPEDSGVEFLLANNWEDADAIRKAVDFCRKHSDSYEMEIQPVIESIRLHEITNTPSRDSADDVIRRGTCSKRSFDERSQTKSFDSASVADPISRIKQPTQRLQSEVALPVAPKRRAKVIKGFHRGQSTPQSAAQSTTPIPAAVRRTVTTADWHHDEGPLEITPRKNNVVHKNHTIAGNSTPGGQEIALPLSIISAKERWGFAINQTTAKFTKSLERHRLNNKVLALVHMPRPRKHVTRSKSANEHMPPVRPARRSPGRMTERKLPPLPPESETEIVDVEESNDGFEESSSAVESSSSNPDRIYERISCQREISNEPSLSAPSSPAPTIRRHLQEMPSMDSPFAYDRDGYLTPVELRDIELVLEKGRERLSFPGLYGSKGTCKKKLGQSLYSSHRRYVTSQMHNRVPVYRRCDSERLQSFLDDSVAELYRKQLECKDNTDKTTDNGREFLYRRNNSFDNIRRKRPHSAPALDFANLPRDESDVNLETILDSECAEIDKEEEDFTLRFLHRASSTSLRARRLSRPASYHGFDSAAFSDSGIASRQSTMRNENRELAYWKAIGAYWTPPEDLSSLSVEEVAMSLRYIGMKDQVAVGFSKELVDGKLLCEMNSHLLKEGFPNMNSLERKKVLDFVHGWRPKRLLLI